MKTLKKDHFLFRNITKKLREESRLRNEMEGKRLYVDFESATPETADVNQV